MTRRRSKFTLAALALTVAVIAVIKVRPYLVFKVPVVGWFLGYLVGIQIISEFFILCVGYGLFPYFDLDAFAACHSEQNCPWLKSEDVVVAACTKCGTNWMMTAVHELRTWDQPHLKDFRDILDVVPWPDLVPYPTANRTRPDVEWDVFWNNPEFKFNEFKSHISPYRESSKGVRTMQMPVRERRDVKFLVMVRNPADVLQSLRIFLQTMQPEYMRLWGSTPAQAISFDEIYWIMKNFPFFAPFHFFDSWMEYAGEENVLILHYSNVFRDTRKHLKIIADFLRLENIPEEKFDEIEERVSVGFMKQKKGHYGHLLGKNKTIPMFKSTALVRKGGIGTSNQTFTDEEKTKVEALGLEFLDPTAHKLLENGFEAILNKKMH